MTTVGILAYGSLIEDPGIELSPLIVERKTGVETPFRIEFARSSSSRCNAPTVIPVENGGSYVNATILVLKACVTRQQAEDLLWRRETRNERSEKHYTRPSQSNPNRVIVKSLEMFNGIDVVLYTSIGSNIENLNPTRLAELAIESAKAEAGRDGKDGISYLISLKRHGISTPLMPAYESEILRLMNAVSLETALERKLYENTEKNARHRSRGTANFKLAGILISQYLTKSFVRWAGSCRAEGTAMKIPAAPLSPAWRCFPGGSSLHSLRAVPAAYRNQQARPPQGRLLQGIVS